MSTRDVHQKDGSIYPRMLRLEEFKGLNFPNKVESTPFCYLLFTVTEGIKLESDNILTFSSCLATPELEKESFTPCFKPKRKSKGIFYHLAETC
jgi:hypothetical protein